MSLQKNIRQLMEQRRWCYWIDLTKPEPNEPRPATAFRVSIVIENEPGHYPTGNPDDLKEPWYWTREICNEENAKRGITEEQAFEIVSSSMFAKG